MQERFTQTIRLHALVKEECSQSKARKDNEIVLCDILYHFIDLNANIGKSDAGTLKELRTALSASDLSENCRKRFEASELCGIGLIKQKTYLIQFNPTQAKQPRIHDVCVVFALSGYL